MKNLINLLLLLSLSFAGPGSSLAADTKNKKSKAEQIFVKDIKRLLILTGSDKLGLQVISNMATQYRTMFPNVPEEFWQEFLAEVSGEGLINLVVPVYVKHYTHDDIKGLIAFYQSPLGRKVIRVMPAVMQESMALGQIWGQDIAEKIKARMVAKGYVEA